MNVAITKKLQIDAILIRRVYTFRRISSKLFETDSSSNDYPAVKAVAYKAKFFCRND